MSFRDYVTIPFFVFQMVSLIEPLFESFPEKFSINFLIHFLMK
jgi:hypothetical protein